MNKGRSADESKETMKAMASFPALTSAPGASTPACRRSKREVKK